MPGVFVLLSAPPTPIQRVEGRSPTVATSISLPYLIVIELLSLIDVLWMCKGKLIGT